MTNDLIKVLKDWLPEVELLARYNDNSIDYQRYSALDLAIKALEQQPCEDAISRSDALKAIEEQKKGFYGVERYAIDECHSAVMKLPPVTPSYNSIKTELEPCEDCISRKEAIDIIYDYEYKKDMRKALMELPSVTPKCDLEPYGGN